MEPPPSNEISYCFRWNFRFDKPGYPMSERRARSRDQKGEEYAVVIHDSRERFPVVITLVWKNDFVSVKFPDDNGRVYTKYIFKQIDEKHLFLASVYVYSYPNEEPGLTLSDSNRIEVFYFGQDGHVEHEINNEDTDEKFREERIDVPVEKNWEPVPTFGDWESIARYER